MAEKQKVYRPKDAICGKCGGPMAYRKLPSGKWCPCNPDGSDHWDDCREAQTKGTYGIKRDFLVHIAGAVTIGKGKLKGNKYEGDKTPWEYPTFIECVEKPSQLKNKGVEFIKPDDYWKWTDGKVITNRG